MITTLLIQQFHCCCCFWLYSQNYEILISHISTRTSIYVSVHRCVCVSFVRDVKTVRIERIPHWIQTIFVRSFVRSFVSLHCSLLFARSIVHCMNIHTHTETVRIQSHTETNRCERCTLTCRTCPLFNRLLRSFVGSLYRCRCVSVSVCVCVCVWNRNQRNDF